MMPRKKPMKAMNPARVVVPMAPPMMAPACSAELVAELTADDVAWAPRTRDATGMAKLAMHKVSHIRPHAWRWPTPAHQPQRIQPAKKAQDCGVPANIEISM